MPLRDRHRAPMAARLACRSPLRPSSSRWCWHGDARVNSACAMCWLKHPTVLLLVICANGAAGQDRLGRPGHGGRAAGAAARRVGDVGPCRQGLGVLARRLTKLSRGRRKHASRTRRGASGLEEPAAVVAAGGAGSDDSSFQRSQRSNLAEDPSDWLYALESDPRRRLAASTG
jgi:hypothetical protein